MTDSPVRFFRDDILIERASETAVYIQIANQLAHAIQRGNLLPASKLPGTRALSEILQVHRNTAVAVYEELQAQGWIEIRPNSGTFVASHLPLQQQKRVVLNTYPNTAGFSFEQSNLLDNPFEYTNCALVFNDGTPDIRLTSFDDLSRFYSANIKRKSNRRKMGYYNSEGSEYFKRQLSNYLKNSRGLNITPHNLLITRSTEMSLFIISRILLKPGDTVVVGSPGYFSANMIFQHTGAAMQTIRVDAEGIDVRQLRELCQKQKVRMVYVTPHHHYPTTVSLSAQRRMELLQLSKEFRFIIVEDDYDYDFYYDKQPLLPLAAADTEGMVIYVGSFGKSLAPGFRTGFIITPENLMKEMRKYLGIIDRQGDILMEQALGEMIEDGVINRHLKKSLKVYKERRDFMASLLDDQLKDQVAFQKPSGGLALWVQWPQQLNLVQLGNLCARNDLFLPKTILYQNKELRAIRMGFGHLTEDEMIQSIGILNQCLKALRS
jgi:GntR family transcriptional regulator/MocR family aminotransferase